MLDVNAKSEGHTAMVVLKVLGGLVTLIIAIIAAVGAYFTIINRMDRLDDRMTTQGKTLETLAASIKTLAQDALTEADLRTFCMQAQIANQRWVCPFTTEPSPVIRQRRARTLTVTGTPPAPSATVPR